MGKKDKTPEERIDEAAALGNIEFAESYVIEDYDNIACEFLDAIFNINHNECFISDESILSDFSSCCAPSEYEPIGADRDLRWADLNNVGKSNMVRKIYERYGIDVTPNECLISVFEKIHQKNYKAKTNE